MLGYEGDMDKKQSETVKAGKRSYWTTIWVTFSLLFVANLKLLAGWGSLPFLKILSLWFFYILMTGLLSLVLGSLFWGVWYLLEGRFSKEVRAQRGVRMHRILIGVGVGALVFALWAWNDWRSSSVSQALPKKHVFQEEPDLSNLPDKNPPQEFKDFYKNRNSQNDSSNRYSPAFWAELEKGYPGISKWAVSRLEYKGESAAWGTSLTLLIFSAVLFLVLHFIKEFKKMRIFGMIVNCLAAGLLIILVGANGYVDSERHVVFLLSLIAVLILNIWSYIHFEPFGIRLPFFAYLERKTLEEELKLREVKRRLSEFEGQ